MLKRLASLLLVSFVAACGGGGGSAGTSPFGTGAGSAIGGGSTAGGTSGEGASPAYAMSLSVQRAGTSTTTISSTETVQVVATVTSSSGDSVEGVVVTFAEQQSTLLKFAPSARTALTDAMGRATIDIAASAAANTGATTVTGAATVGTASISASKSIEITAGALSGGVAAIPAAINFVGSNPSGTAIVVKGTGGTGRSESAILTFRVVDLSNAPVNGTTVTFSINSDNGGATITPTSATSNSDGLVTTTVSSGVSPASIVVQAAAGTSPIITSQSDTLIVSNSVPFEGGFEIVAERYNLDGRKTGDSTQITAFVRDVFGNPVPDGVAVSFQTDFGAVASSTLGGCTTVNGMCKVDFRVQDPRPLADGIATVTATVRVGDGTTAIAPQTLKINMAGASGSPYLALDPTTLAPLTNLQFTSCKQSFELLLSDGSGHAPAAGTTISVPFTSTGVVVSVKNGSPVLDQLATNFPPVIFGVEIDLTSTDLAPLCKTGGVLSVSPDFLRFGFTTPSSLLFTQRVDLAFPQ